MESATFSVPPDPLREEAATVSCSLLVFPHSSGDACDPDAVELAKKKIRVNCISPGFIETEMMDSVSKKLGKEQMDKLKSEYLLGLGKPKDVANACLFLLSDASRWITGINLPVDGGYTCK